MTDPWKACDIRGVFPTEVSTDLLRRVGSSVATNLSAGSRVLIAGDFRLSTPRLKATLAEGLLAAGARVLDAGQVATPVAYFARQHWKTDAVLIVTASHNPPEYNGLKLMIGSLPPAPEDFALLRHQAEEGSYRRAEGSLETIDPVPAYQQSVFVRWQKITESNPIAVVLDAGNGAWSELAPHLFERLGFRVHPLFCEIDGSFPNRSPDCARAGSVMALQNEVLRTGSDLGIAWDGDGDRVAFVDGTGSIVSTDEVSALMIHTMVAEEPGAKIVYDIKLSEIVRRSVLESGGRPIMERSGHTFIKRRMIREGCLLGCEASGHYFFRELHGGDDGLFAALFMTQLVARRGLPLAQLRGSLTPFFVTPDLRFSARKLPFGETIARLRRLFDSARETTIDGLRLETPDGYVLARESVTEPVVTMRVEGFSDEKLRRLIEVSLEALPEVAPEISAQVEQMKKS